MSKKRLNMRLHKVSTSSFFTTIIMGFMFLGSLNFINRYYYCIYIAFAFFLMAFYKNGININQTMIVLLLFSLSILVFNPDSQTMITNMIKPFTYFICYFMGCTLLKKANEKQSILDLEKKTRIVIYVISSGAMLHFVLNMITNLNAIDRNVIDFWTKNEMSATGQATLACLMIAVSAAFLFSGHSTIKKIIAFAILLVIVQYNLILAGRTIFVFIAIAIVFAFAHRNISLKKSMLKTIVIFIAVISVLGLLYSTNTFGIKTAFEDSNFYYRFFNENSTQNMDDDARLEHKLAYVTRMLDYPWGGHKIRDSYGHSAHDLYLDTYSESGVFAFLFIIIYIISSLRRAIKCMKDRQLSFETKQLIACVYLIINIQFWLEPILRGVPWLLASYCFIDGVVTFLIKEKQTNCKCYA